MTDTTEPKPIDRTGWPPGPWMNEPDRVDFRHAGLPCLILRSDMGHLCGYVAVPPGHPLHGVNYRDPSEALRERLAARMDEPVTGTPPFGLLLRALCGGDIEPSPEAALNCHGGLTYSGACSGRICHAPEDGEPDNVFWFGFDCAHSGDLSPGMLKYQCIHGNDYRTVEYVRAECESLAEQLAAIWDPAE